jgi:2-iminobutanoate/2-iminopropanoate deaminase
MPPAKPPTLPPDPATRPRTATRARTRARSSSFRAPVHALAAALLLGLAAAGTGCTPAPPAQGPGTADPDAPTERVRIDTERAPAAIGPYSQGVLAGGTLYLAGQIALDPESGELVGGGIEGETRQVMENLGAVLDAAGMRFDQVVQAQVFLVDLDDFQAMNAIYAGYFGDLPPARATVQVAALPRGARVEIQLTAVR